ncbi:MAG: proteasome assembly chaperone family protein [Nitrososphaerales archaeon]
MSESENLKVVFNVSKMPSLREPYLVCGWPGSGYVGRLAVEHLVKELDAKLLADIYSYSFPPQVVIRSDGVADLMKNSMYYWKGGGGGDGNKPDMLLLTGDAQPAMPEAEYLLVDEVLNLTSRFKTHTVFTLAAYITGVFVDKPKVYATATDPAFLKEFESRGMLTMDGGGITGMNGLLIGVAKLKGMRGVCLLGETSGYVVDAKASKAVLQALLDVIDMKVDMENLEKRAKETEMLIKTIEQQMRKGGPGEQPQREPGRDLGYIS